MKDRSQEEPRRQKRSQRDYSLASKLAVVGQVEKGELSYKQAQRKYGIQGRSTVLVWLRKLGNLEWRLPKLHQMQEKELVTDAYSRKIVGHHLHESLHTDGVEKALLKALRGKESKGRLIHHSDRGLQYCSEQYQRVHRKAGLTCSMKDGYDSYQNALAERVNGILKEEFLVAKPRDIHQARKIIEQSVWIYNSRRPHLSLNYKTPNQVHHEKALISERLGP